MTTEREVVKYDIGVRDEALQRRADHVVKADAWALLEGHLHLYLGNKLVGLYAPGGWTFIRPASTF